MHMLKRLVWLYFNREKTDASDRGEKYDQKERKERDDRRDRDKGDRSHPPAKRMRDEPRDQRDRYDNRDKYDNRYDNRARSAPRGREFVRGSRSRGRGRGVRGASTGERGFPSNRRGAPAMGPNRGSSREYRGYENHVDTRRDNRPRGNAQTYADTAKPFSIEKWSEDTVNEAEDIPKRRRDKDEESDVSVDDVSSGTDESNKGDNMDRHTVRQAQC